MEMTAYEKTEIQKIHAWKNPNLSSFDALLEKINYPLTKAGEYAMDAPVIGKVIEKSIKGIVEVANDAAQYSVRAEAIFEAFAGCDKPIKTLGDINKLELAEVDRAIGCLAAKYKGLALAEGAGAGAAGLLGSPIDIGSLRTLKLRAIGEYATYCGFDINLQEERLFAMNVLGLASSPSDAGKQVAMAQLVKIAKDVAQKRAWKELQKNTLTKIIQNIAEAVGVRLTKAKLAQIIPIAGAIIGGGFNSYYTAKVCEAANFLYRERFLARKYGAEIIEISVKFADPVNSIYEEPEMA